MIWALLISVAFAKESWICTEESSLIQNDKIMTCGIGVAKDEDSARTKAFNSAKDEFDRICKISSSCNNHAVNVEPKRTTCEKDGSNWKCYRMLSFAIGEKLPDNQEPTMQNVPRRTYQAQTAPRKDVTADDFWQRWNNKYLSGN
jgi:hypothetical protein